MGLIDGGAKVWWKTGTCLFLDLENELQVFGFSSEMFLSVC